MKTNSNKGIIYCRVSSQEQTKGTSLDGQKQACLEYAENKGIKVVKIFIEKGESATAANRTELIKALDFCKENKNEIVAFIVWKIDRFARNTVDHYGLIAQLSKYGTRLHSVTEPISDDPIGRMTEAMLAGYAQFENDIRKQRCEGGLQRQLAQGIWPWTPPIGYLQAKKITDRRKTRPDEPDPERFYFIQKGIRAYMNGRYSLSELAKITSDWGLRTRTDKPMTKQLWERTLKNKFYAGIIVSPWTGQESQGQHQPMITLEEYNQIQLVKRGFSRNALAPRLHLHPDFPLRSFVLCACGGKLSASWRQGRSKKYPRYHCFNRNCQHYTHSIDKFDLEDKFKEFLTSITPQENYLKLFEETVLGTWKGNYTVVKQERTHYEGQLKKLEDQRGRLIEMRMKNEISKEEFLKLKDNLDNQITGVYISRNEVKISEFDFEAAVIYAVNFARDVVCLWQEADDDVRQKQRLQKLVLPKGITYDKNAGEFGTAVLSQIFKLNESFDGTPSNLVAGVGIAPTAGGS